MIPLFALLVIAGCVYAIYAMSAGKVSKAREPYRASLAALQQEFGGQIVPASGVALDSFGTPEQVTVLVSGHGPVHDAAVAGNIMNPGGWYTMVHAPCRTVVPTFIADGARPDTSMPALWTPERLEMLRHVGPSTITCGGRVVTVAFDGICTEHARLRAAIYLARSIAFTGAAQPGAFASM